MKKTKRMLTKAEVAECLGDILDTIPEENSIAIEALQIAQCEMARRYNKYSTKHAGKAWTEYEDNILCIMFEERCKIKDICEFLGRSEKGCAARLKRLGVIQSRKEMFEYLQY